MRAPIELLSFRRTFALLIILVVVPSAGLSGFGVVAIINERAAVEKRLEAAWSGRLAEMGARLVELLRRSEVSPTPDGLAVLAPGGETLTSAPFVVEGGAVRSPDKRLEPALQEIAAEL